MTKDEIANQEAKPRLICLEHYADLSSKPFFKGMIAAMQAGTHFPFLFLCFLASMIVKYDDTDSMHVPLSIFLLVC